MWSASRVLWYMVLPVNYLYRGKADHIGKKLKLRQKFPEFDSYQLCTTPGEAGELTPF